jgi:2-polyprenyl-3-methyl-5-hydroxy-6-metoxy-1,4-benzoquinol methylase
MERIPIEASRSHVGHVYRYELAAKLLQPNEVVLEVACGIGYGAKLIQERLDVNYVGVDKITPDLDFVNFGKWYSGIDLDYWSPTLDFDVSICFETLEHVNNPKRLASQVARAKRLVIISVPTRPTMHLNQFHLHDFTVNDVLSLFEGHELLHLEDQPEELSHIFVFKGGGRSITPPESGES